MHDLTGIKYKVDDDKWYRYKGVKPPVRQSHGISEDDIEEVIRKHTDHKHEWKQKGNYIFCTEGPNEHGKNIGVHKRLTGTDKNGEPILSKI